MGTPWIDIADEEIRHTGRKVSSEGVRVSSIGPDHPFGKETLMSLWLVLLIAAVVLGILGFAVAKWLFIVAVILLVAGLIGIGTGRRGGTRV